MRSQQRTTLNLAAVSDGRSDPPEGIEAPVKCARTIDIAVRYGDMNAL